MRYGIFSDIHANLEALESVEEALSCDKIDLNLCTGDIIGYGADPEACIKKTRSITKLIIGGNHDAAVIGTTDTKFFNSAARRAVLWTRERLVPKDENFLKKMKLVYKNTDLEMVHGTLYEPELFHYMLDAQAAYTTFSLMKRNICFVGHTHSPGIFALKLGTVSYLTKGAYSFSRGEKLIVNTGSVGQPRDGDPRASYCIYDTEKRLVEIKRCPYDIAKAQKKIIEAGLPESLAKRLSEGA